VESNRAQWCSQTRSWADPGSGWQGWLRQERLPEHHGKASPSWHTSKNMQCGLLTLNATPLPVHGPKSPPRAHACAHALVHLPGRGWRKEWQLRSDSLPGSSEFCELPGHTDHFHQSLGFITQQWTGFPFTEHTGDTKQTPNEWMNKSETKASLFLLLGGVPTEAGHLAWNGRGNDRIWSQTYTIKFQLGSLCARAVSKLDKLWVNAGRDGMMSWYCLTPEDLVNSLQWCMHIKNTWGIKK
jgi:hypothetical protein